MNDNRREILLFGCMYIFDSNEKIPLRQKTGILKHRVKQRTDAVCLLECNSLQFRRTREKSRILRVENCNI